LVKAGITLAEATFNLSTYLSERQALVEEVLERSIAVVYPEKIYEAMRYSLLAGENACAQFSVLLVVNYLEAQ